MFNKCINCNKWITCKDASEEKNNCEKFDFKRIQIKKDEREIKNEEKKENKKSN